MVHVREGLGMRETMGVGGGAGNVIWTVLLDFFVASGRALLVLQTTKAVLEAWERG